MAVDVGDAALQRGRHASNTHEVYDDEDTDRGMIIITSHLKLTLCY